MDGFRFDLGSIMTRAHSQWHRTSAADTGKPAGLLSGGKVQGVQGEQPSRHGGRQPCRHLLLGLQLAATRR